MASSQKFPSGLNKWVGSDKPTRSDFVNDNQILDAATRVEIATITLPKAAWTQEGDRFSKAISNPLFMSDGYVYRVSIAPDQLFTVGDLGGVAMVSVADGQAVFQCRSKPEMDITMQVERAVLREGA